MMNKSITCFLLMSCLSPLIVKGDSWMQKASLPSFGRDGGIGFTIGASGYLGCGGGATTGDCYNDLWEYNPASDSWTQKADVGSRCRYGSVGFAINGKG